MPWTRIDAGRCTAIASVPMRQVHDGWSAVSASLRDPVEDLLVGLHRRPGRDLAAVEARNAGWERIVRATRIASTHSRRSSSVER